jgi:hypothetical protein
LETCKFVVAVWLFDMSFCKESDRAIRDRPPDFGSRSRRPPVFEQRSPDRIGAPQSKTALTQPRFPLGNLQIRGRRVAF